MESLNEFIYNMQTKVRKQLEILQLKGNFIRLRTHDTRCYEQYVGIKSRHPEIVSELRLCHLKICNLRRFYFKVTLLDHVIQQIALWHL